MYTEHFNFREPPFSIAPDPRFLYLSPQHREALAHLLYGIGVGGGFVALTGEVGTGKTTLCRCLLEQLPEDVDIALVFNPRLNSRELLATVCDELHVVYPGARASLKQLIDSLNQHLLDAHARGRRTIVLIDEAQNLSIDVLEQVRLLTNLETNQAKLLQIVLVGQPELNTLLARPNLRQLSQRITARYFLKPLSRAETGDYLRHRLTVAGVRRRIFTRLAVRAIYGKSGGIPRLINLIADRTLLGAYSLGKDRVSWWMVRKAARELLPAARRKRVLRWAFVLLLASIAVVFRYGDLAKSLGSAGDVTTAAAPVQPKMTAAAEAKDSAPVNSNSPAPPSVPLSQRLAAPDSTRTAAFARLLAVWHVPPAPAGEDGCAVAARSGLDCLLFRGSWPQLRNLDHPAALELVLPDGNRRYAVLLRTAEGKAELGLGDTTQAYDLIEVFTLWKGNATLLWKPREGKARSILPGDRSDAVRWIRQRLGMAAGADDDLFDPALKARVISFQLEHGLSPDGMVGAITMIHLGMEPDEAARPRLKSTLP